MPHNTNSDSLDGLTHAIQKVSGGITAFEVDKSGTSTNGTPPYIYIYIYIIHMYIHDTHTLSILPKYITSAAGVGFSEVDFLQSYLALRELGVFPLVFPLVFSSGYFGSIF